MKGWLKPLLGSRQSFSLTAFLLVTPIGVAAAPLAASSNLDSTTPLIQLLLVGLLAQIPLGAVLFIGGFLSARFSWSPTINTCLTLLAGAARGLAIAFMIAAPDSVMRAISSAITMAIWLLVIGAALESHKRYLAEVNELLGPLVARELQGRLLDDEITDLARSESAPRIAQTSGEIRSIVDDANGDYAGTAALLQDAIENRLRPLSHDLWFSPNPVAPLVRKRFDVFYRILQTKLPVKPLFLCSLLLLAWGSFVLHRTWKGAIVGVTISFAYALVLLLANRIAHHERVSTFIRYVGVGTFPAFVGGLTIVALHLSKISSTIAVALGLPLITFGISAAVTLKSDRAKTLTGLRARLADPDWDHHLGALVRREVDATTATTLHNSVQTVLTATALQLQLAANLNEPSRALAALDRAMQALNQAETPSSDEKSARYRLVHLAETWQGIADVQMQLPQDQLTFLEWSLLADVVGECIANSIRHGQAKHVDVVIGVGQHEFDLMIADDGRANEQDRTAGLGTTWLGTVVQSASEETRPDGLRAIRMTLSRKEEF